MRLINKYFTSNFEVLEYDEVSSTMEVIKNFPANTILVAKKQTAGRGKYDRRWDSATGNLYFSMFIKADKKLKDYSQISFLSGVAMREALAILIKNKTNFQCKWPNDILLNEKKLCGILLEFDKKQNQLIIGIGVNIKTFPKDVMYRATSLENEGFMGILSQNLLKTFLEIFSNLYRLWDKKGFSEIRKKWLQNAYRLNNEILVRLENSEYKGIFEDLDEDGSLILRMDNNKIFKIKSGDVF